MARRARGESAANTELVVSICQTPGPVQSMRGGTASVRLLFAYCATGTFICCQCNPPSDVNRSCAPLPSSSCPHACIASSTCTWLGPVLAPREARVQDRPLSAVLKKSRPWNIHQCLASSKTYSPLAPLALGVVTSLHVAPSSNEV